MLQIQPASLKTCQKFTDSAILSLHSTHSLLSHLILNRSSIKHIFFPDSERRVVWTHHRAGPGSQMSLLIAMNNLVTRIHGSANVQKDLLPEFALWGIQLPGHILTQRWLSITGLRSLNITVELMCQGGGRRCSSLPSSSPERRILWSRNQEHCVFPPALGTWFHLVQNEWMWT